MHSLKENILIKFFLSALFTLASYYVTVFKLDDLRTIIKFINGKEILGEEKLLSFKDFMNESMLPVIITWIIIGIFVYLIYYLLSLTYYYAYNWILINTTFVKKNVPKENNIRVRERLSVHFLVLVLYSILFAVVFLFLFPLSELIREGFFNLFHSVESEFFFLVSFLAPLFFWFISFTLISILNEKIKEALNVEEIKEEHFAAN